MSIMREFLRRPRLTGVVAPSSPTLAQAMTSGPDLEHADTVVELGSGTGAITEAIRRRPAPGTRLVTVELNPVFARLLADRCGDSPSRWSTVRRGPADARPPPGRRRRLRTAVDRHAARAAVPDPRRGDPRTECGRFRSSTFAYVHTAWAPPARRFAAELATRFSGAGAQPGRLAESPAGVRAPRVHAGPNNPSRPRSNTSEPEHTMTQHSMFSIETVAPKIRKRYLHECARERRRRGHCRPTARRCR